MNVLSIIILLENNAEKSAEILREIIGNVDIMYE